MDLETQRRLASKILDVGKRKVWFDPLRLSEIEEAITRQDIKELIKEGAIKKLPAHGVKIRAGKKRKKRFEKGRRRGTGKIKKKIRKRKIEYILKIRKIRRYLKMLKKEGKISKAEHLRLRKLAKAGLFSDINKIKEYIQTIQK